MTHYKYLDLYEKINDNTIENDECSIEQISSNVLYFINDIVKIEKICKNNEKELHKYLREKMNVGKNTDETKITDIVIPDSNLFTNPQKDPHGNSQEQSNSPKFEPENQEENPDISDKTDSSTLLDRQIYKKLYKYAALYCHPDKTSDRKLHKIFSFMTNNKNNIIDTLYLMMKANINLDKIKFNKFELVHLNLKVFELEKIRINLKNSIVYNWDKMDEACRELNTKYIYENSIK